MFVVNGSTLLLDSLEERLHVHAFALWRTVKSAAFILSFVTAGVLLSTLGVTDTFLIAAVTMLLASFAGAPVMRRAWPRPAEESITA